MRSTTYLHLPSSSEDEELVVNVHDHTDQSSPWATIVIGNSVDSTDVTLFVQTEEQAAKLVGAAQLVRELFRAAHTDKVKRDLAVEAL